MVNPLTVTGDTLPLPVMPAHVAVYAVTALPPSLAGAVKLIIALMSPAAALPMVGAPGALPVMLMVCVTCGAALTLPLPA